MKPLIEYKQIPLTGSLEIGNSFIDIANMMLNNPEEKYTFDNISKYPQFLEQIELLENKSNDLGSFTFAKSENKSCV